MLSAIREMIYCAAATCFLCSFINFSTSSSIILDDVFAFGKKKMDSNANPQKPTTGWQVARYQYLVLHCWDPPLLRAAFFFGSRLGPDFLSRSGARKAVDWHHFGPDREIFRPSNEYPYFVHFWTPFSLNFLSSSI